MEAEGAAAGVGHVLQLREGSVVPDWTEKGPSSLYLATQREREGGGGMVSHKNTDTRIMSVVRKLRRQLQIR